MENLLKINNIRTVFRTEAGIAPAVDDVSLQIPGGKTVALVGESGCGKSVLSLSVLDLVPRPAGRIESGSMYFEGQRIPLGNESEMQDIRGNKISMIFQEPMTALNPVMKVGRQIVEAIRTHDRGRLLEKYGKRGAYRQQAIDQMEQVGLPDPARRFDDYPHNLSGGMRQRVMIAMAIACRPQLLIADEPTTALDVTVQAQIMELLAGLQAKRGMSILLITHDLGLVEEQADYLYVMYAGRIVEEGATKEIIRRPGHPYTAGLLASRPEHSASDNRRLQSIPGQVPEAVHFPDHCRFADRCPQAAEKCRQSMPEIEELEPGRRTACFYPLIQGSN